MQSTKTVGEILVFDNRRLYGVLDDCWSKTSKEENIQLTSSSILNFREVCFIIAILYISKPQKCLYLILDMQMTFYHHIKWQNKFQQNFKQKHFNKISFSEINYRRWSWWLFFFSGWFTWVIFLLLTDVKNKKYVILVCIMSQKLNIISCLMSHAFKIG